MNAEELYDAASKGDATKFQQLLQQDPYLLERVAFPCSRNLLHIATLRAQVAIVEEVLKISPELALDLDSKNSSSLHIAAAKGNVEIAKRLLLVAPEMCWCRDGQGLNPVHVAAMKGHVGMLEVLLRVDRLPAMERVQGGQTVLHLCVKHHQLRALKFLVEKLSDLVYAKDDDGETLLHWAVRSKKVEVLKISLQLARNLDSQKLSPLHIAAAQDNVQIALILLRVDPEMCWCRDDQGLNPVHVAAMKGHVEMLEELLRVDPLPAMERVHRGQTVLHLCVKHRQLRALQFLVDKFGDLVYEKDDDEMTPLRWAARRKQIQGTSHDEETYEIIKSIIAPPERYVWSNPAMLEFLSKKREQTMVVMTLIATMAFQAAVNPPGGVWQEDKLSHRAGKAVMESTHPNIYKYLIRANTIAFVSSIMTTIFLVVVPQPIRKGFLLVFSSYAVWISLASIAVSYGGSVLVLAPNTQSQSFTNIINVVVAVPVCFIGVTLLWNAVKWPWQRILRTCQFCTSLFNCLFTNKFDVSNHMRYRGYLG